MRKYFADQIRRQSDASLTWVLVQRKFAPGEIEAMVAKRARQNHPMNSIAVFQKYHDAFEVVTETHHVLQNPGPEGGEAALVTAITNLLNDIYED